MHHTRSNNWYPFLSLFTAFCMLLWLHSLCRCLKSLLAYRSSTYMAWILPFSYLYLGQFNLNIIIARCCSVFNHLVWLLWIWCCNFIDCSLLVTYTCLLIGQKCLKIFFLLIIFIRTNFRFYLSICTGWFIFEHII